MRKADCYTPYFTPLYFKEYPCGNHQNIEEEYDKGCNGACDYSFIQGHHPYDYPIIPTHIDLRHITVENSGKVPVRIGISLSFFSCPEKILTVVEPEEVRDLAINSQGSKQQYLWVFDMDGNRIADPHVLAREANSFVLRQGFNGYWSVQRFYFPTYGRKL